jgi:hypothetical protein
LARSAAAKAGIGGCRHPPAVTPSTPRFAGPQKHEQEIRLGRAAR